MWRGKEPCKSSHTAILLMRSNWQPNRHEWTWCFVSTSSSFASRYSAAVGEQGPLQLDDTFQLIEVSLNVFNDGANYQCKEACSAWKWPHNCQQQLIMTFFCHLMHYNEVASGRHIAGCKLNHNWTRRFEKESGDRHETGFNENTWGWIMILIAAEWLDITCVGQKTISSLIS